MTALLHTRIADTSPSNFNNSTFRYAMAMNNANLAKAENTQVVTVEPTVAHKYTGDFFGLLKHLRIPDHYHWFIAYANGVEDSQMYDGLLTDIIVIDNRPIDDFSASFRTTVG